MSKQGFGFRFSGLMGFIAMILVLMFMYFIITGAWKLLAVAAPVLIVLALIINYKTIVNFLRFMLGLLQRNVLSGIIAIILCVVLFPFLSGILFGKSILDRKVNKLRKAQQAQDQGEFVDYEEVIRPEREDKFDLPPMEKPKPQPKENPYKDLF